MSEPGRVAGGVAETPLTRASGATGVHRARPGVKLAMLAAGATVLFTVRTPWVVGGAAAITLGLAALARIPARELARQARPALLFAGGAGALQAWSAGPLAGVTVAGSLVVAVVAASIVTLTTGSQEMLDAIVGAARPLRRLGVDPERVALTLTLAVTSIPVVARLAGEVRQARMARGAERSVRALAVPLVIRTVRHADRLGEALRARGADDD
ncbi:MAG TPA: energy-coupling factor transporter transmembrane protein EcfT [Kineosporiaceae bacterium]